MSEQPGQPAPTDDPPGWTLSIARGLKAYFKQPSGPSKQGTEWLVDIDSGSTSVRVIVRVYCDDVTGMTAEQESQVVAAYVGELLNSGWRPSTDDVLYLPAASPDE